MVEWCLRSAGEAEVKKILFEAGWSKDNIDRTWLIISETAKRSAISAEDLAASVAMVLAAAGVTMI